MRLGAVSEPLRTRQPVSKYRPQIFILSISGVAFSSATTVIRLHSVTARRLPRRTLRTPRCNHSFTRLSLGHKLWNFRLLQYCIYRFTSLLHSVPCGLYNKRT